MRRPFLSSRLQRQLWRHALALFSPYNGNILPFIVYIVAGIVIPLLEQFANRTIYTWSVALFCVSIILFWAFWGPAILQLWAYRTRRQFFEPMVFGEQDEETQRIAAENILRGSKAEPSWVHVAPKHPQFANTLSLLNSVGWARISDRPGCGKSMLAYQVAYAMKEGNRLRVYRLKTDELESCSRTEFQKQKKDILTQLDYLPGKNNKLVVVDDAHKLQIAESLRKTLECEAVEGSIKCLWIEIEAPADPDTLKDEDVLTPSTIRLELLPFIDSLIGDFYNSTLDSVRIVLVRAKALDDALQRVKDGKITDIWHFNFCASCGWDNLERDIIDLDDLVLLVLFQVSAYAVLSGEKDIHTNTVIDKIHELVNKQGFRWIADKGSVIEALDELSLSRLIKVKDRGPNDRGYIATLHYNFSRQVITVAMRRTHLADNLVDSIGVLLNEDYETCRWVWMLRRELGEHKIRFDETNSEWLQKFMNNIIAEHIRNYSVLLKDIKETTPKVYDNILEHLEPATLGQKLSATPASHFAKLATFLRALKREKRAVIIGQLCFSDLATTASHMTPEHFTNFVYLMRALGKQWGLLAEHIKWEALAGTACSSTAEHVSRLASLLTALGDQRTLLTKGKLWRWNQLAHTTSRVSTNQLGKLAQLFRALREQWGLLAEHIEWEALAGTASRSAAEDFSGLASLLAALRDQRKLLTGCKLWKWNDLAYAASQASANQFEGLAQLFRALDEDIELLLAHMLQDTDDMMHHLGSTASYAIPEQLERVGTLLASMGPNKFLLIQHMDLGVIARTVEQASPHEPTAWGYLLRGLTITLREFDEEHRRLLVSEIDWVRICMKCPLDVSFLGSLGNGLSNLIQSGKQTDVEMVGRYLEENIDQLREELGKVHFSGYRWLARFLWNCNLVNHALAHDLAVALQKKFASNIVVRPSNHLGLGNLINSLNSIDPAICENFLQHHMVKGKIIQSINTNNWSAMVPCTKHMVKAICRASQQLWNDILAKGWITADLSSLDLPDIYIDIETEKATASGPIEE